MQVMGLNSKEDRICWKENLGCLVVGLGFGMGEGMCEEGHMARRE